MSKITLTVNGRRQSSLQGFSGPPERESRRPLVLLVSRRAWPCRVSEGQQVALHHLMPLAVERVGVDPRVAGDYYRGDLLKNILCLRPEFWEDHAGQ
jgi:CDI immunity proteins